MSEENQNENLEQNNQDISEINKNDTEVIKSEQNSQLLKFVVIIVVIFLATFAAVYTVVDMTMYKLGFQPFITLSNQVEKMLKDEEHYFEKNSPAPVKIETKNNKYIVTVDMKSFNNDESNFNIDIKENGIKISGEYQKDKEGEMKQNSFYQNVIFPNKINADKAEKGASW